MELFRTVKSHTLESHCIDRLKIHISGKIKLKESLSTFQHLFSVTINFLKTYFHQYNLCKTDCSYWNSTVHYNSRGIKDQGTWLTRGTFLISSICTHHNVLNTHSYFLDCLYFTLRDTQWKVWFVLEDSKNFLLVNELQLFPHLIYLFKHY